jgi:hypothetical protein
VKNHGVWIDLFDSPLTVQNASTVVLPSGQFQQKLTVTDDVVVTFTWNEQRDNKFASY